MIADANRQAAERESGRLLPQQRQARADADAARQGQANAAAGAASAQRAAQEAERRVREEAAQSEQQYLRGVEREAQEWNEQRTVQIQTAIQESVQEQLKAKLMQMTAEADAKDKPGCRVRAHGASQGHPERRLSKREQEARDAWEAKFLADKQDFHSACGVGPHRAADKQRDPSAVPPLPAPSRPLRAARRADAKTAGPWLGADWGKAHCVQIHAEAGPMPPETAAETRQWKCAKAGSHLRGDRGGLTYAFRNSPGNLRGPTRAAN